MRLIRSLMFLLAAALATTGCAQQPVVYVAYPGPAATRGIDNMVYGAPTPSMAAMSAQRTYAAAPYPNTAAYATSPNGAYATVPQGIAAPAPNTTYGAAPYAPYAGTSYGRGLYAYAPTAATAGAGQYTLDSGDRLRIVVFGQEGLTNSYVVSASGTVDMPLVGSVTARGATSDQLASRISEKLRNGFIREPHVAVEIEAYRPFFILGEVTAPGQYPYVANMTVETAIAIAGGFTQRASRSSVILNRNYYGQVMRMAVPLTFPLRPGDTLNVQERWF